MDIRFRARASLPSMSAAIAHPSRATPISSWRASRVTNYAMVDGRIVNQSIEVGRIAAAANTNIAPAALVPANSAAEQVAAGAKGTVAVYRPVVLGGSQLGAPATLELGVPTDDTSVDVDPDALAKAQAEARRQAACGRAFGRRLVRKLSSAAPLAPTPRLAFDRTVRRAVAWAYRSPVLAGLAAWVSAGREPACPASDRRGGQQECGSEDYHRGAGDRQDDCEVYGERNDRMDGRAHLPAAGDGHRG